MTGAQLKANHGQRRFVILKNGDMLELLYDMNAVMRHETLFEVPMSAVLDPMRERITNEVHKAAPHDESPKVLAQRVAAAMAREMVRQKIASGHIRDLAEWAYCLTETWREDHEIEMSWSQFRKLLHEPPPSGAATVRAKKKLEQAMAWMMAVAEVRAREEIDDEGNDQAEGTEQGAAPSVDLGASIGISSTPSQPSSANEATTNSGV